MIHITEFLVKKHQNNNELLDNKDTLKETSFKYEHITFDIYNRVRGNNEDFYNKLDNNVKNKMFDLIHKLLNYLLKNYNDEYNKITSIQYYHNTHECFGFFVKSGLACSLLYKDDHFYSTKKVGWSDKTEDTDYDAFVKLIIEALKYAR